MNRNLGDEFDRFDEIYELKSRGQPQKYQRSLKAKLNAPDRKFGRNPTVLLSSIFPGNLYTLVYWTSIFMLFTRSGLFRPGK